MQSCRCARRFYLLTERRALRLPTPPPMRNKGNFVISLRCAHGRKGCPSAPAVCHTHGPVTQGLVLFSLKKGIEVVCRPPGLLASAT